MLRKSHQQGLDFRNLHVNMKLFRSTVAILSLLKVKNGENIEKSLHPLSLTCVCLTCCQFLIKKDAFFVSAIISWSGMKLSKS